MGRPFIFVKPTTPSVLFESFDSGLKHERCAQTLAPAAFHSGSAFIREFCLVTKEK
jgi:hypothetical protein